MGDDVTVEADVFTDGHDAVVAELLWKYASDSEWRHAPMTFLGNDHWTASFRVEQLGRYEYTVHAWTDALLTWQRDLKKREAQCVGWKDHISESILDVTRGPKDSNRWLGIRGIARSAYFNERGLVAILRRIELA